MPFVSLLKPKYVMQQRACPHPSPSLPGGASASKRWPTVYVTARRPGTSRHTSGGQTRTTRQQVGSAPSSGGRESTLWLEGLTPFCQTSGGQTRTPTPGCCRCNPSPSGVYYATARGMQQPGGEVTKGAAAGRHRCTRGFPTPVSRISWGGCRKGRPSRRPRCRPWSPAP